MFADMFTILKSAIPITALMQAQHGKMYPRIGYALSVV